MSNRTQAATPLTATPAGDGQVTVDCPHCEDTHRHGVTPRLRAGHAGSRVADCSDGGYEIRLDAEAVRRIQRGRIDWGVAPAMIAGDLNAINAVASAYATVPERPRPAFKIQVTYRRDSGVGGPTAAILEINDLRIWGVDFDTQSLTLVPAAGFQWDYSQEGSSA